MGLTPYTQCALNHGKGYLIYIYEGLARLPWCQYIHKPYEIKRSAPLLAVFILQRNCYCYYYYIEPLPGKGSFFLGWGIKKTAQAVITQCTG